MSGFDTLVRGALVFDGHGAAPVRADVAINGERIAEVGNLENATAAAVIEANGQALAPGFIDVHTHTDLTAYLADEHVAVKVAGLLQGVTTEICGNCGASAFPMRAKPEDDPYLGALSGGGEVIAFPSLADYRRALATRKLAANIAPLVGHGTIRATVMGNDDRAPSDHELRQMRRLTAAAMEDGAFGLSTGLIYSPGVFSRADEIVALAGEVARRGRVYTSHMRDEADNVEEALDEAIAIGRATGAPVQVSHHKLAGRRNWGRSAQTLAQIESARGSGLDVAIDVYPYAAGSTFLSTVLPPWTLDGGAAATAERLRDPLARLRMKQDTADGLAGWQNLADLAGWESIVIAGDPPYAGHSVAELARSQGQHPVDIAADILIENAGTVVILHMMDSAEVETIGSQAFAMVGSDGIPLPGQQHPRLAGTFARALAAAGGDHTRLADVIRRMTSFPAGRFHIPSRGAIEVGYFADMVLFDPAVVRDQATYESPLLPPVGIRTVFLAGREVVRGGEFASAWNGKVLEPV